MKSKVTCSFGEIIDKISILKIKQGKAKAINNHECLKNIETELTILEEENPLSQKEDSLFRDLAVINGKLWVLEDLIRDKSAKKEFDQQYIEFAEKIHKTNDLRCQTKKAINLKYGSEIIEEKIYNDKHYEKATKQVKKAAKKLKKNLHFRRVDYNRLEKGKLFYTKGNYKKSRELLVPLMKKFREYSSFDPAFVDLMFSYANILSVFGEKDDREWKRMKTFMASSKDGIPQNQVDFCNSIFASNCLQMKDYELAKDYVCYLNVVNAPGISPTTMSFFRDGDVDKTLLVYDGGGIGDEIMLARLLPILCERWSKNRVTLVTKNCTHWMYKNILDHVDHQNLEIYPQAQYKLAIRKFDYHCSMLKLMCYLNIGYDDLTRYDYHLLEKLNYPISDSTQQLIKSLKPKKVLGKKTYIFNWKGNPKNGHEKHNRMMPLQFARPLFKMKNTNWIIITKDINEKEKKLLENFDNVKFIGNLVDNGPHCYMDSIHIMRAVNGVVTTDTSMVHITASLNVKTYALLTKGNEWRWATPEGEDRTNWYPSTKLFKQKKLKDWSSVVAEVMNELK